jgi:hypothetical protein
MRSIDMARLLGDSPYFAGDRQGGEGAVSPAALKWTDAHDWRKVIENLLD